MDSRENWYKRRRWVNDSKLTTSSMGTYASERAISDANISKDEIDFIIFFATLSPDYYFPGSGVLLQRNLGIKENLELLMLEINVHHLFMDYQ